MDSIFSAWIRLTLYGVLYADTDSTLFSTETYKPRACNLDYTILHEPLPLDPGPAYSLQSAPPHTPLTRRWALIKCLVYVLEYRLHHMSE